MRYQEAVRAAERTLETTIEGTNAGERAEIVQVAALTGIAYALLALAQAVADRPAGEEATT